MYNYNIYFFGLQLFLLSFLKNTIFRNVIGFQCRVQKKSFAIFFEVVYNITYVRRCGSVILPIIYLVFGGKENE